VAIVSTSINPTPEAYALWARQGTLFVAGDSNSPDELQRYVEEIGGVYLTPVKQTQLCFAVSNAIGWRCEQRRNMAVLKAYSEGYDFIVTVDDDNEPLTDDFVEEHVDILVHGDRNRILMATARGGWVNPGTFGWPRVAQRGLPYYPEATWNAVEPGGYDHNVRPVVSQAIITGSPDCDALYRLTHNPTVVGTLENVIVDPKCYAPFGSQATVWDGEWAPLIACLPVIRRSQDIYASFIFQRIAREHNCGVRFGGPVAHQERNDHNPYRDLEAELWGLEHTLEFTRALDETELTGTTLWEQYHELGEAVEKLEFVDRRVSNFMHEWSHAWAAHSRDRVRNRSER